MLKSLAATFTLIALSILSLNAEEKEKKFPKNAFAIPGVAEHVVINRPKEIDASLRPPMPVWITYTEGTWGSHITQSHDIYNSAGYVTVSILDMTAETGAADALNNLVPYLDANAEKLHIDPKCLFFSTGNEGRYQIIEAFTNAHPDRVKGWLVSPNYFKDTPYPTAPPKDILIGMTATPDPMERWKPWLDAGFAAGNLIYDIPLHEQGDRYYMHAVTSRNQANLVRWLIFAYYAFKAPAEQRDQYLTAFTAIPLEQPLKRRVAAAKRRSVNTVAPNKEELNYLTEKVLWPGVEHIPWQDEISSLRLKMLEYDLAHLRTHDNYPATYRAAASLYNNKTWKKENKDAHKELKTFMKDLEKTVTDRVKKHMDSYDSFCKPNEKFWEKTDDQKSLPKFGKDFEKIFAKFEKQYGGHEARDRNYVLINFLKGSWQKQLKLPKPEKKKRR